MSLLIVNEKQVNCSIVSNGNLKYQLRTKISQNRTFMLEFHNFVQDSSQVVALVLVEIVRLLYLVYHGDVLITFPY